jgi:aspartate kinase
VRDEVLATGERLSVALLALLLRDLGLDAASYDAAALIRTDGTHGAGRVDHDVTRQQVRSWYAALPAGRVPVVTGFIGATADGATTTLGRGGSDYSAALLASAHGASVLERWTDEDGIYTDDPRTHRDAKRLASIVLSEAQAWNHAGRLGMHRQALDPLVAAAIPVHVRSTAAPDLPGTRILPAAPAPKQAAEG